MKTFAALISLVLAGCASFEAANNVQRGSPRFFAGSRLDAAALSQDEVTLEHFERYGITPPEYPGADLVPSLAADLVLLPFALSYTITEPLLYLP